MNHPLDTVCAQVSQRVIIQFTHSHVWGVITEIAGEYAHIHSDEGQRFWIKHECLIVKELPVTKQLSLF